MIYKISSRMERVFARLQGKGWGVSTMSQEVNRLAKFVSDPLLGIDIGANSGEYTARLKNKFKNIEVHLFEPAKTNHDKLVMRFAGDEKAIINKMAVSNINGFSELFSNEAGSGLASLTRRRLDHYGLSFDVKEKVETIRFEDYWRSTLSMKTIDILKIDVEGHELDVLRGLGDSILKTKLIQFEFGGTCIDTKTYFQDYWYFFKQYPFKIFRITPLGLNPVDYYSEFQESFLISNFLCINQSLL